MCRRACANQVPGVGARRGRLHHRAHPSRRKGTASHRGVVSPLIHDRLLPAQAISTMVTLDAQAPKAWLSDLHMWRCALRARATGVLFHIVQQQGMVGAAASTLSSLVATAMQPTGAAAAMNDSQAQTLFTAGLGHVIDHARVPAAGRLLGDCNHTPCAPLHSLTVCVLGCADLDVGSWRVCSCCSTLVETDTSCATCGSDEKSGKDRTKVWRQGVVGCWFVTVAKHSQMACTFA